MGPDRVTGLVLLGVLTLSIAACASARTDAQRDSPAPTATNRRMPSVAATQKRECEPLKAACERAQRLGHCAQERVNAILQHLSRAQADIVAEVSTAQATGRYAEVGFLVSFATATGNALQEVAAQAGPAGLGAAEVGNICALPTPQDDEACRRTARQVEDRANRTRDELKRSLERSIATLEATSAAAYVSPTRARLLASLQLELKMFDACQ